MHGTVCNDKVATSRGWIHQSERRGECCQQGIEVSIFDFLDCPTDDEQVTVLTPLDYNNIL